MPADGGPLPGSPSERMASRRFRIPNTVVAYWGGAVGGWGKDRVDWDPSVSYLKDLGFRVEEYEHRSRIQIAPPQRLALQKILENRGREKELHGLYFWGHGYEPYPSAGLVSHLGGNPGDPLEGDPLVWYGNKPVTAPDKPIDLPYAMALGLVFACDSDTGRNVLVHHQGGEIWKGFSGTLIPIPPLHVSRWIKPGMQRTRTHLLNGDPIEVPFD